ncbi:MFS transporter [bacterium]|nr:MFS transporter [bacterium]
MSESNPNQVINRTPIIIGLMISVALAALDVTIVATALPTIVAQLSGVELYSWLVSIYLLTSTTSVPLYGQLADNLGRKPILLWGIILFTLASVACTQVTTMNQLIVMRAIQGLGAGAILPMTMTIIGDLFSIEERAKYQGLFSGVWGVSSIVGPALGAVILTWWHWHGIFYINLPVGIVALTLIVKYYHEHNVSSHRSVDVWGALLLTVGVGALLVAVGQRSGTNVTSSWLYAFSAACIIALIFLERQVKSPILPLPLITRRIIGFSYLIALFGGIMQFGLTAYMPLFVQGAMGGTPTKVGMTMAPVAIGWPLGSVLSGKMILKWGYKRVLVLGMSIGVVAIGLIQLMQSHTPIVPLIGVVMLGGFSLGLTTTPLIIAVQNAVDWKQRGITTALNQFSRTIGGVIGVAVMGVMLNNNLSKYLGGSALTSGYNSETLIRDMLEPAKRGAYPLDVLHLVQNDLADAMHEMYLLPLIAVVVALLLVIFTFPGGKVEKHSNKK